MCGNDSLLQSDGDRIILNGAGNRFSNNWRNMCGMRGLIFKDVKIIPKIFLVNIVCT